MRQCAFLTLEDRTGFVIDDELAYPALAALGWNVEAIPWNRSGVHWETYDAVVIRSTWDYIIDPEAFVNCLTEIERTGVPFFNGLDLVRWNLRKTYLRELSTHAVDVAPTIWGERLGPGELAAVIQEVGTDEVVIKPVVGANASGAFRINAQIVPEREDEITRYFAARAFMAQPFLSAVINEGEFSLFYFNGEHSHTILKTPKPADFRVQEEHGGFVRAVPTEPALREVGDAAMRALATAPLYARADFVRRDHEAGFWLMELELIEPSLYFRTDSEAPARFARALNEAVRARV